MHITSSFFNFLLFPSLYVVSFNLFSLIRMPQGGLFYLFFQITSFLLNWSSAFLLPCCSFVLTLSLCLEHLLFSYCSPYLSMKVLAQCLRKSLLIIYPGCPPIPGCPITLTYFMFFITFIAMWNHPLVFKISNRLYLSKLF